jgi:hypothetical protein
MLAILTVLVTLTMLSDWRRAVNPYRHMFTTRDRLLARPASGPLVPEDGPAVVRRGLEIALRSIPLALVGFWAWICTRLRPTDPQPEARWRAIRNVHLAWWSTLAVGSGLLRALGT